MRSPRSRFELACRAGVFALLGWLLGASLIPSSARRAETVSGAQLERRLAGWTRLPSSVALHASLDATPSVSVVDWLSALAHSGHSVTWTGSPLPLVVTTEAVRDPRGGTRVEIAAPNGSRVVVRDDASALDSLRVASFGGSVTAPDVAGRVVVRVGAESASVRAPDTTRSRSIVVVGGAGWEGKFIVFALEERGWLVVSRFSVAPNVDVGASALVLDTARVAAVIAVDTLLGALSPNLDRFVRSGGGLVLAGTSGLTRAASSLAPGSLGARYRPPVLPPDTIGLGATGFYPVVSLSRDAVALERRTGGVTIAARRVGAGRVLQVGYDDSWRWRMAGGPGSDAAHGAWWSGLVSAVAYAPPSRTDDASLGSAPLAAMVARIGPARPVPEAARGRPPIDHRMLMIIIMILLISEWGSRRLRGLR
jgi:hypothetical protein